MSQTIESFFAAPTANRFEMVFDKKYRHILLTYFGKEVYNDYCGIASKYLRTNHLAIKSKPNLIFVPGVMGSMLRSKTKGGVWWIDPFQCLHHINDLGLSNNGLNDADETNLIVPFGTVVDYEPFFCAVLNRNDFGHADFPFDWRKPFESSTSHLKEVILRIHSENGERPVHVVAHSMGGLLVRATLMTYGIELWPIIGKIIFLGTPHYGSPAIAGYLKNHLWGFDLIALLGLFLKRVTFRSLWGVLSLLPAPKGVYPGTRSKDTHLWHSEDTGDPYTHPCANFDMYNAGSWSLDLNSSESSNLQKILNHVSQFHENLYEWHVHLEPKLRNRMLTIAGVGYQTLFRLSFEKRFWGSWEKTRKITTRRKDDPHREGDGRVPLASARLEDVPTRYVKGIHGSLTNLRQVYENVFRWLRGEPLTLPKTPHEALSAHLAASGRSEAPFLDGTGYLASSDDDPGLWNLAPPDQDTINSMKEKLEDGGLPGFTQVRLL